MKLLISFAFLICGLLTQNAFSQANISSETIKPITDGPYIERNSNSLDVTWICKGESKASSVAVSSLPYSFSNCGLKAHIDNLIPPRQKITYAGEFKVAALIDLHGQYDLMLKLLRNNKIIDAKNNWNFGKNHFVITGDVFDRGDKVTEILWFLYTLERQALAAGGNLHFVLGNHEVMVLNNNLKYLHPKYLTTAKIFNVPFADLFNAKSVLGAWIRSKNVLVKVNDSLFTHGGFHPNLVDSKFNLHAINNIFKENLVEDELEAPRVGFARFLHKGEGVIWYRGYFNKIRATRKQIDSLLAHFDVNRIVVGHTSHSKVVSRYDGKVIGIDTSIKRGLNGEVLFIERDKIWRAGLNGEILPLEIEF